ncbi:hypothetical protein GQ43DRAFT_440247 [Delitschia confertaspora ATCC 74209]|uniref:Uncharacterized protein n=1 Tax=Delitschia confertaspora ATCC 74209 TaxID=1513339 RepID=A0A9P4JRH7_9PLEO|nr:hypothetical protein GQ43DRAFT_440247 [Delitschia confertaspora ATCC 74209]
MLPSLIRLEYPDAHVDSSEDLFSTALGTLFPDDLQNQHGDPEARIIYSSALFGDLEFKTANPNGEEERRKFAHYLWNAGVLMGEMIGGRGKGDEWKERGGVRFEKWWVGEEEHEKWRMEGETVLELGAGVGLAGIVSALAGAEEVTITDYPAPPILSAIKTNVAKNVPSNLKPRITVEGHEWGQFSPTDPNSFTQSHAHHYTRILAADCLWIPHEHRNLLRSMLHFLSPNPKARAFVIAGFHTGRKNVAGFFEEVEKMEQQKEGLEIEEIWEMDANGERREWRKERDGGREDHGERKKWLVVARLKRRETSRDSVVDGRS